LSFQARGTDFQKRKKWGKPLKGTERSHEIRQYGEAAHGKQNLGLGKKGVRRPARKKRVGWGKTNVGPGGFCNWKKKRGGQNAIKRER